MDRFDCQLLMATFVHVYQSSFIKYVFICIYMYLYVFICIYMCLYVFICIYMYLYVFICIYMYLYVFICIYMYLYVFICIYMYLYVFICIYMYLYVFICIYMYLYVFICIYMYLYVFDQWHVIHITDVDVDYGSTIVYYIGTETMLLKSIFTTTSIVANLPRGHHLRPIP